MPVFLESIKRQYGRYRKVEIQTRSAALAFHTLLSVVPLIGLIFWYIKSIGLSKHWFNMLRLYLLSQLNFSEDSLLLKQFDRITAPVQGHSWGWVGIFLVTYTVWNLIDKFGRSVDSILDTAPDQHHIVKRGLFKLNLRRLLVMLALPVALLLSLAVTQWIQRDSWFHYLTKIDTVGPYIALPIAWTVDIVAISLIYYFIPRSAVPWKEALKAALVVGPTSEIIKMIFGIYSKHALALHRIYGIFVVVPLFVLWVQLAWMIVLCGAFMIRFDPVRS